MKSTIYWLKELGMAFLEGLKIINIVIGIIAGICLIVSGINWFLNAFPIISFVVIIIAIITFLGTCSRG